MGRRASRFAPQSVSRASPRKTSGVVVPNDIGPDISLDMEAPETVALQRRLAVETVLRFVAA